MSWVLPRLPTCREVQGAQSPAVGLGVSPNLPLLFLAPLPRVGGVGGGSSLATMLGCSTPGLNVYAGFCA